MLLLWSYKCNMCPLMRPRATCESSERIILPIPLQRTWKDINTVASAYFPIWIENTWSLWTALKRDVPFERNMTGRSYRAFPCSTGRKSDRDTGAKCLTLAVIQHQMSDMPWPHLYVSDTKILIAIPDDSQAFIFKEYPKDTADTCNMQVNPKPQIYLYG